MLGLQIFSIAFALYGVLLIIRYFRVQKIGVDVDVVKQNYVLTAYVLKGEAAKKRAEDWLFLGIFLIILNVALFLLTFIP